MDLNQHDMDELRHAAWKAQAVSSPHALVTVPVEASKLLWLLEQVEEHKRYLKGEQHLYDQETEKTINDLDSENQSLRDQLDELKGQ